MTEQANERTPDRADAMHLLSIYLEDHLAVAVAGVRRAHRLADAEKDEPDGRVLAQLADDIERDLTSLRAVIEHFDVAPHRYKQLLARGVELGGLLKLNGRLFSRSPLTTLVETEAMLVALRGKLAGWESLRAALGVSRVGSVDLDVLMERGRAQLEAMATVHEHAAVKSLSGVADRVS